MKIKKEDLEGFICPDADEFVKLNITLDRDMVENLNKLLESKKFLFENSKIDDMITYLLVEPIDECLKQLEENKED